MSDKPGLTLRAQWLGQQLRELRATGGFTLKQVGEYLQRDTSTVGRYESGEYPVRRPDMLAMLDFYGVSDKRRRDGLLQLHADSWQKGWWDGYADDVDQTFVDYVWLESRANTILAYDVTFLIGLLQTEDYARAVITAAEPNATQDQIDRWVELRMARQEVLAKPDFHLRAVLDEALLHRAVGGPDVLRAQLSHLLKAAKRPNVDIRVLPFGAGAHASPGGAFKLFLMPDQYPAAGYVETPAGNLYVESPKTGKLLSVYDGLQEKTLGQRKSIEIISAIAEE